MSKIHARRLDVRATFTTVAIRTAQEMNNSSCLPMQENSRALAWQALSKPAIFFCTRLTLWVVGYGMYQA
jgi:hypothetical protein